MTVWQYVGNTAPSVPDTLTQTLNGVTTPINLAGGSVTFNLRSLFGSAVLVSAPAVIVVAASGTIRYDWTLADVTTAIGSSPGPYRAWWSGTVGGQSFRMPEFPVEFLPLVDSPTRAVGPCTDWCSTQDVIGCYPGDTEGGLCLSSAVTMASEVLYEMSGHQFTGWCQSTIRPCSRFGCFPWPQILSRGHIVWGDRGWYGDSGEPCQCGGWLSQVELPGIAQNVVSVVINGDTLSPTAYRLDPNDLLVRIDGGAWPICQNLAAADDGPGAFSVTYAHGYQPPEAGRRAAAQLAHEFWLACAGQPCSLPTGTVEVTRQGITIKRNSDLWSSGSTGLALVDSFLAAYNSKPGLIVMSPEVTPTSRRTQ